MNTKISAHKFFICTLFLILLFIMCFPTILASQETQFVLQHIDEGITVFFLIYVCVNYKTAIKINKKIMGIWIVITLLSLVGNVIWSYQKITGVLIDACIICPRFIIGYYTASIYAHKSNEDVIGYIRRLSKVVIVILFALSVHDILFPPLFAKGEYRYFMNSISLMFSHETYLAFASATLMILIGCELKNKKEIVYLIMASFLCLVTLRSKAVGFVVVYWGAFFYFYVLKRKKFLTLGIIGFVSLIVMSWDSIYLYFIAENRYSPRNIMLKDGIKMMIEHLPLGTGFGTYGSAMAAQFYSPLYVKLGYLNYRGMNETEQMFLTDSFWPSIFSQFGLIGTVLFVLLLFYLFKKAIKKLSANKKCGMSMLMIMIYLCISSTAETAFFNPAAMLMFIIYALLENKEYEERKINEKNIVCDA